jgi:hypothetical protein
MLELPTGAGVTEELANETAPASFRQAIVRDPSARVHRLDQDALRGEPSLIDPERCPRGGDPVPRDGYYLDLDGNVIKFYRAGTLFPKYGAVAGAGGRFFFITHRRDAAVSDLLYIALRAGYPGDVWSITVI